MLGLGCKKGFEVQLMFKWLRGKINKKINHEMNGCVIQNLNFVSHIREEQYLFKREIDLDILNIVSVVEEKTKQIQLQKKDGDNFNPIENDTLLEMNKYCRNIWTNYFKCNALRFDKEFSTEKLKSL